MMWRWICAAMVWLVFGRNMFFSSLLFQLHEGPRVQGCYIGQPPGVLVLWIMFFWTCTTLRCKSLVPLRLKNTGWIKWWNPDQSLLWLCWCPTCENARIRMQLNSLGIEMFHGRNSHHVSKPYSTGTISKNSLHAGLISLLVYLYQTRFSTKLLCSLMVLG